MPTNKDSEIGILEGLPSTTNQYPYKGLEDFWSHIDEEQARFLDDQTGESSEYVVFTNVDNQTFTRDFDIIKHKSSWRLLDSYEPSSQILLVRAV